MKLLRYEGRKLLRQKSFYICGLVVLLLTVLEVVAPSLITSAVPGLDLGYHPLATERLTSALSMSNLELTIMIFTAINVAHDYSERTILLPVGKGYSRGAIFFTKFAVLAVGTVALCAADILADFVTSLMIGELGPAPDPDVFVILGMQVLAVLTYLAMYLCLATLCKKTGTTIVMGLLVIGLALPLVLVIADLLIDSETFQLADYWISGGLDRIFNTYYLELELEETLLRTLAFCGAYLAVFLTGGWLLIRRREI